MIYFGADSAILERKKRAKQPDKRSSYPINWRRREFWRLSVARKLRKIQVELAGFEPATHGLGNRNRHFMACRDVSPSRIFYYIIVRDVTFSVAICRPLWCQKLVSISLAPEPENKSTFNVS